MAISKDVSECMQRASWIRRMFEKGYELKARLAERFGADRLGYNEAKTEFIESVLARARAAERERGER